jgi:hypothetical protein
VGSGRATSSGSLRHQPEEGRGGYRGGYYADDRYRDTGLERKYHKVNILVEMQQGQCICPLSWSVHCNFTGEGKCSERGWACTPPPLPARAYFTLMMECTPEIGRYHSVYTLGNTTFILYEISPRFWRFILSVKCPQKILWFFFVIFIFISE